MPPNTSEPSAIYGKTSSATEWNLLNTERWQAPACQLTCLWCDVRQGVTTRDFS